MYFSGAALGILVFDVTNKKSFEVLPEFVAMLKEKAGPEVQFILVGNKVDLPERTVDEDTAEEYAKECGAAFYIETSAKTGFRVDELFQRIGKLTITAEEKTKKLNNPVVEITEASRPKDSSCC